MNQSRFVAFVIALISLGASVSCGTHPSELLLGKNGIPQLTLPTASLAIVTPYSLGNRAWTMSTATGLAIDASAAGVIEQVQFDGSATRVTVRHSSRVSSAVTSSNTGAVVQAGQQVQGGSPIFGSAQVATQIIFRVFLDGEEVCPIPFLTTSANGVIATNGAPCFN